MIVLPCKPADSLDWALPPQGSLLWRFDLGLEDPFFPIDDEMHFQTLSLALAKFSQEIWKEGSSMGAVLYRGSADFSRFFSWGERQICNWGLWREGRQESVHLRRLFCANAFAHYFQMLAHKLPDEMPLYLLLDATGIGSIAERHQLLSRERFEHFLVATKGIDSTNGLIWEGEEIKEQEQKSPRALCLPEESRCCESALKRFQERMGQIEKPFRVIAEPFLTEEWEGVDVLHVLAGTLSPQGERKIKGFQATGGIVIF